MLKHPLLPIAEILLEPGVALPVEQLLLQDPGYNLHAILVVFDLRFRGRLFTRGRCVLSVNGRKVAIASGAFSMGQCLARWVAETFASELKALCQADGDHPEALDGGFPFLGCVHKDEDGRIKVDGSRGLTPVVELLEMAFGITLRFLGDVQDSSVYMLARCV